MSVIWTGLATGILICALFKNMIADYEIATIILLCLHVPLTLIALTCVSRQHRSVFAAAYVLRLLFLFWDMYASGIYSLPNSGSDSEVYYQDALRVYEDPSLLGATMIGGVYSKIIGLLFCLVGPQRMLAQYINVLLGVSVVYVLYKTMTALNVKPRVIRVCVTVAALFPNSLIMSAILLREVLPTFFVAASLYFLVSWLKTGRYYLMILTIVMTGLASTFHSGVIGVLAGYTFLFLFYDRRKAGLRFTPRTVMAFVLVTLVTLLGYRIFGDLVLSKFGDVKDMDSIYLQANTRLGNSAYLTGISVNNPVELAIFGPLKAFFFLTAPLPMDWRGLMDMVTFLADSLFYLATLVYSIWHWRHIVSRKAFVRGLVISLLSVSFIFGIGVGNAGTAVRHRQKLTPIFVLLLAVTLDQARDEPRRRMHAVGPNRVGV